MDEKKGNGFYMVREKLISIAKSAPDEFVDGTFDEVVSRARRMRSKDRDLTFSLLDVAMYIHERDDSVRRIPYLTCLTSN